MNVCISKIYLLPLKYIFATYSEVATYFATYIATYYFCYLQWSCYLNCYLPFCYLQWVLEHSMNNESIVKVFFVSNWCRQTFYFVTLSILVCRNQRSMKQSWKKERGSCMKLSNWNKQWVIKILLKFLWKNCFKMAWKLTCWWIYYHKETLFVAL